MLRLGLRVVTGFDLLHAFRQRRALRAADVIWTHTESQFLAVAAVLAFAPRRPRILGQSVWLFDRWPRLNPLHRLLYRRLIRMVDVLTVHSSDNLAVARALFPDKRVLCVPFGIPAETMIAPVLRPARPLRILAPAATATGTGPASPKHSTRCRMPRRSSCPARRRAGCRRGARTCGSPRRAATGN